jgi:hypothetical protein
LTWPRRKATTEALVVVRHSQGGAFVIPSLILLTASLAVTDNGPSPYANADLARTEVEKRVLVGEIKIVGNTRTRDSIILKRLLFFPGCGITARDVRVAEDNLARTKLFKFSPKLTILDEDAGNSYKTVLIQVEEREPTHPWESDVDDFMAGCTHYLAVGLWILLVPELAASIGEPLIDGLDDWRVYKAHSRCEALWDEVEIVMYQAVAVSSDRVRTVQQSLMQAVRSCFPK